MKMELIQPFINAADAVLSQGLQGSTKVGNLTMEEEAYRRKGVAGMIALTGDIEGRIILDLEPQTAVRVASHYAGADLPESDALIKETIFELANQVVGNAISALNDQGFHFRVHPPLLLTADQGDKTSSTLGPVLTAWGVGHLFSARAVYLQVGAMLGTIMAANVLFVIIPGHWELVKAKKAGREPDPKAGIIGKQRSVHNNYLTLPVVFAMLSNHFPATYGHSWSWLILIALMTIGAWIRHFFNLRHAGRTVWWIPLTAALGIAAVAVAIRPSDNPGTAAASAGTSFPRAQSIVRQRCVPCHSASPTRVAAAPLGIQLDTAEQMHAQASAIERVAVESSTMPLGNATGMTAAERAELGAWIRSGAKIK